MVIMKSSGIFLFNLVLLWGGFASGAVNLPLVFTDHMVLQRERSVPIWGTADPGERVRIQFAGQDLEVTANPVGAWRVELDALEPSAEGRPLVIGEHVLKNVVVGDVWLCSGQSNMWWPLKSTHLADKDLAQALHANLRLLHMRGAKPPGGGRVSRDTAKRFNAEQYFSGAWTPCRPSEAADFSAVSYYFGRALLKNTDVPIGLICNAVGGSPTESWVSQRQLERDPGTVSLLQNWFENPRVHGFCRQRATSHIGHWLDNSLHPRPRHPFEPHALFDYGIESLTSFAIKGAIWYQGESNAPSPGTPFEYDVMLQERLLTGLIEDWREHWGYDFPFYFVQLPEMERDWAAYREMQRRVTERVPNTGMAVTLGLGNPGNVHPRNKVDVGERLARLALYQTYGQKTVVPSGPRLTRVVREGAGVRLHFDHAEGLKGSKGFELAGSDDVYVPAAVTIEGSSLLIEAPRVSNPHRIRYAWGQVPDANLVNHTGLPASPFEMVLVEVPRKPRFNVLFLVIDDLRTELGCYGAEYVASPHIDQLAARGVVFDRAYCQASLCNPSRTSVMTGFRPESTEIYGNHVSFRQRFPSVVTLPQQFKSQGYHAVGIGKIYHGPFPDGSSSTKWDSFEDPESWSEPAIRFGPRYYFSPEGIAAARKAYRRVYKPNDPGPDDWRQKLCFGLLTEAFDGPENLHYDGKVADATIAKLRELKDRSFFIAAGFIKPHSPWVCPSKYFDLYDRDRIPLADHPYFPENGPSIAGHNSSEPRRYPPVPKSGPYPEDIARELRHGYFACVSFIDAQVGRILDELDELGLRDNTVVALWGDHGYHLGDLGLWGKLTNFERGTRVPLIVSAPGMKRRGTRSEALVELLDVYPSLCELAGVPIPVRLQGTSFAPLLDAPQALWKKAAYSVMYRGKALGHSVRTGSHRYTEWREGGDVIARELYDYREDPVETTNVVDDIQQKSAVLFCQARLNEKQAVLPESDVLPAMGSFESLRPGEFKDLNTSFGRFLVTAGRAEIDPKHAHDGNQCLHLFGGKETTVEWAPANLPENAVLHFWAERWTSRSPFSFRIDGLIGETWKEVYNGDARIRVGRSFLNEVRMLLPKGVTRLRLRCSSPEQTGILIDELSITAAEAVSIRSASCRQVIMPALIGKDRCPVLELSLEAEGMLNPKKRMAVEVRATGSLDPDSIRHVHWIDRSGKILAEGTLDDGGWRETFPISLSAGKNMFRLAVTLSADADWEKSVDFRINAVHVDGERVSMAVDDPVGASRIGIALRTANQDGVVTYRIPGIATTGRGTLVAVYDNRNRSGRDLPGDIDVGMSRSTDGGRTWEPMRVIMDMGDDPKFNYDGVGDPAILVDQKTDTLWVAATWSHGNRSWHGSRPGLRPEETGQFMLVKSEDDGRTWSEPINITRQVKDPAWNFVLQGPGNGITLEDGTLVFPAQYKDQNAMPFSTIIYSKDRGITWEIGRGVKANTTESQVVQLKNGDIMINCRDNRGGSRSVYTTSDLGQTWKVHPTSRNALPEPVCNAGLLRIGDRLFFSNPPQTRGRHNITIKVSDDMGMTWPDEMHTLVDEYHGAYSVMTPIGEKYIGLLYEGPRELYFVRFSINELAGKARPKVNASKSKDRSLPNILLIVSEDNGPELGCYGDPYVQTPVLDRLAGAGTLFENAHVPYSVCSPSRAVFLTGLYPVQNGHLGLATHKFAMYEHTPNVFSYLQRAGYFTGLIGKLHVNPESAFSPHLDFREIPGANFGRRNMGEYSKAAAKLFEQSGDRPFFLSINYPDAHYPLHRQQFGLPECPLTGKDVKPLPWVAADSPRLREFTADYYNCMARLDAGIGQLLQELEIAGKAGNTLVIYMGDHGAQFSRGKCSVYEAGTRIPLIFSGPGIESDQRRTELVSSVDLLPTLLQTAGLTVPVSLPGKSLLPLLEAQNVTWRTYLSHLTTGGSPGLSYIQFSIRDARWKLIYSPRGQGENRFARAYLQQSNAHFAGGTKPNEISHPEVYDRFLNPPEWELYDLETDPMEFVNLAEDPVQVGNLARMKKALITWQNTHADPMIDPQNVVLFAEEQADAAGGDYRKNKNHRWQYLHRFHAWRKNVMSR